MRKTAILPFGPMAIAALSGVVLLMAQPRPHAVRATTAANKIVQADADGRDQRSAAPVTESRVVKRAERAHTPKKGFLRRACALPDRWIERLARGRDPGKSRGSDIILVLRPPHYVGTFENTSHSGPDDYLQHVPLVFYGPGVIGSRGPLRVGREVTLADVAPTHAALLGFDFGGRAGVPIEEVAAARLVARPRVMVTISIDGGGWNVLRRWPRSWPHLARLMQEGTSIQNAVVGSSPSITPAVHTTMSTGSFPRDHGVTAIAVRQDSGAIVGAFTRDPGSPGVPLSPRLNLRTTTLADEWDRAHHNRPKAALIASGNYPLGLLGGGAAVPGGDRDIALLAKTRGAWVTDRRFYSRPGYAAKVTSVDRAIRRTDRIDGRVDGNWRGHPLVSTRLGSSPASASWVERTAVQVLEKEGFGSDRLTDLLYVHFKSPDHVGHLWNMNSREMADVLASVDRAIGALAAWLEARFPGRFLLTVTADHGQTPLGHGGWAIDRAELRGDLSERFDHVADDAGVVERTSATSLFMNEAELRANHISAGQVAEFLSRYTIADNVPEGEALPGRWRGRAGERLFAAAFPSRNMPVISRCAASG